LSVGGHAREKIVAEWPSSTQAPPQGRSLRHAGPRGTMRGMAPEAAVVHSPGYCCDIGPHVFPMEKFGLLRQRLAAEGDEIGRAHV
jgi:hypothetical protein